MSLLPRGSFTLYTFNNRIAGAFYFQIVSPNVLSWTLKVEGPPSEIEGERATTHALWEEPEIRHAVALRGAPVKCCPCIANHIVQGTLDYLLVL